MADLKPCVACGEIKSVDEFYKNGACRDAECKICIRARSRQYYANHAEAERRRQKTYYREHRTQMLAVRADWAKQNIMASRAHSAVYHAIKIGLLTPEPCRLCNVTPGLAHHEDYSKPLDVDWLCAKHHNRRHSSYYQKDAQR